MAKRWLSLSLEKKVRWIAACAGAVVFFSIGANLLVAGTYRRGKNPGR